ncbi:MAG: hypothetical protein NC908_01140 [Candidatus Omnitrophica bacterium]|nr:hypothetical protein [Candidatus Omnitrophota bacterium]
MSNKKDIYQKPELKPIRMLEVGAALCCRATAGACTNTVRAAQPGKQRTSTSS